MRKIPTLFVRDPDDMRKLTREVHPECKWVLAGEGVPTRKYDGTCVMLDDDGNWWARREVKPGKTEPPGFVEVEHDEITGKRVGWEPIEQAAFAKYHAAALRDTLSGASQRGWPAGTYELVGPKVNGNPERLDDHLLWSHAHAERLTWMGEDVPRDYDTLRDILLSEQFAHIEGIVWHHPDGRMAKIKRKDIMP